MAEEVKDSKSLAENWAESLFSSIDTPVEIFFLGIFVVGVVTISMTLLVGPCGRVDDIARFELENPRDAGIVAGSTVVTRTSFVSGQNLIAPGVCGVVDTVDEESGTADVLFLAKAPPRFVEDPISYRPVDILSELFVQPVQTVIFLHTPPPSGDVPVEQLISLQTRPISNFFRNFYFNYIWIVMFILLTIFGILLYTGRRFEKKRVQWYEWHLLRGTYRSRLMQNRSAMIALQQRWQSAQTLFESEEPEQWKQGLTEIQDILSELLILLRFEGEDAHNRLEKLLEKDLWMIEKLWRAYSVLYQLLYPEEEEKKKTPPISKKVIEDVRVTYEDAFIWFGLLLHKPAP